MATQRILVTGGAGFIGSHLCCRLLNDGHTVLCLDNFFTGSRDTIQPLLLNDHFHLIEHDLVTPYDIDPVDQIYHLACPASPVHYQKNAIKTVKTNVLGTIHALGMAKRHGARFLQASTSEVYGDPTLHPQPETYWGNVNPIGIRSCYDEGKRVAETLCFDYHRQNNVDIRVARIFNTFGPHMAVGDGRVVSNFITQALTGQPLTLYGDGNQTRSFCYVSDMVDGLVALMTQEATPGPINLGSTTEVTMRELADVVLALTASSSEIVIKPLPGDDPVRRRPDLSLAERYLDWRPNVSFQDGLRYTVDYFKSLHNS